MEKIYSNEKGEASYTICSHSFESNVDSEIIVFGMDAAEREFERLVDILESRRERYVMALWCTELLEIANDETHVNHNDVAAIRYSTHYF